MIIMACKVLHNDIKEDRFFLSLTAPSMPINVIISTINATAISVRWDEPAVPNGIIQYYIISISSVIFRNHTNLLNLTVEFNGLTPNTNYTFNISAITVEPGNAASLSFTTPSCKCVIVLMCYVMYRFY